MKLLLVLLMASTIFISCKKEETPTSNNSAQVTDADIYTLIDTSIASVYLYADAHWSAADYATWINQNGANYEAAGTTYPTIAINPNTSLPSWQRVDFSQINEWESLPHTVGFSHELPTHGTQQYYELIGKYSQFRYGWDTYTGKDGTRFGDDGYDITYIPQQMTDYASRQTKANDFFYYKNSFTMLSPSLGSGHSAQPLLRTRYNIKATTQLDTSGKVKLGTVFPDSSLIVMELIGTNGTTEGYAFMYKFAGASNADSNGWIWGEATASGGVTYSVSNKGSECSSCHSTGINYTRMNDAHP